MLIWSGVLKRGFVGCIRELILNDEAVDMVHYAEEQDIGEGNNENCILTSSSLFLEIPNSIFVHNIESIEPVCRTDNDKCVPNPCFNHGECVTGWNRFTCDCSRTEFIGPTCSKSE